MPSFLVSEVNNMATFDFQYDNCNTFDFQYDNCNTFLE